MRANPFSQSPPAFAVLALLIFLAVLLSREASTMEDLPAFLPPERGIVHVELIGDDLLPGVYQFYDGLALRDVIKLTDALSAENLTIDSGWLKLLSGGESFEIVRKDQKIKLLQRGWMSASHRMALGIPLHPDRMSRTDWKSLPGIGDVLAERIENNRHKNGDYGCLEALVRVKGIGEKRIDRWKFFFDEV
jgi:competence protein ComEA